MKKNTEELEFRAFTKNNVLDPDKAEVILFSKQQKCFHSESLNRYLYEQRGYTHRKSKWDFEFLDIAEDYIQNAAQLEYYTNLFFKQGILDRPYHFHCDCSESDGTYTFYDGVSLYCPHCLNLIYNTEMGLPNG